MKYYLSLLAALLFTLPVKGATVDSISVYSKTMKKNIQVVVISPEQKESSSKPVIYLLHGHGGNAKYWLDMKPELKEIADRNDLIFVCPDASNSWYWDSPVDSSSRYETFVSQELITHIDSNYPTIPDRSGRAITGLSMGGHGAIWLSFRHKNVFGAAGSTSGGVDIRPFPNNWGMHTLLGKESENQDRWEQHTAINQIDRLKNNDLAIIIDCGYDDFFFEVNNDFHKKLLKYKINHDFIVRPGSHNRDYWRNSIEYQVLFFRNFFTKQKNIK